MSGTQMITVPTLTIISALLEAGRPIESMIAACRAWPTHPAVGLAECSWRATWIAQYASPLPPTIARQQDRMSQIAREICRLSVARAG